MNYRILIPSIALLFLVTSSGQAAERRPGRTLPIRSTISMKARRLANDVSLGLNVFSDRLGAAMGLRPLTPAYSYAGSPSRYRLTPRNSKPAGLSFFWGKGKGDDDKKDDEVKGGHKKGGSTSPSNKEKHQGGDARRKQDQQKTEKGDKNRKEDRSGKRPR